MGIGRREFMRLTGLALAGLAIDPSQAVVINNDLYVNKNLGILFHKPHDWYFVAVKDFGKLKSEQIIGKGLPETAAEIWEELGEPICVATKYDPNNPAFTGIFSPTITLNITPREELEDFADETFEGLIELSEYGTARLLKDFKVIKRHTPYFINGCKFYEFDAEYLFEHIELNAPLKVELKSLTAEHNGIYYDFNCHQSRKQHQTADKEFAAFKRTITLL